MNIFIAIFSVIIGLPLLYITAFLIKVLVITPRKVKRIEQRYQGVLSSLYFPILGWFKSAKDSEQSHNDAMYVPKKMAKENPNLKCILSNFQSELLWLFMGPEECKAVFQNPQYYKKQPTGYFLSFILKEGVLNQEGDNWKKQRQCLAPHFNYDIMKNRFNMINEVVQKHIQNIKVHPDFKETMYLDPQCKKITSEIVYKSFFSNQQSDNFHISEEVEELVAQAFKIMMTNPIVGLKMVLLGDEKATTMFRTKDEQKLVKDTLRLKSMINDEIEKRKQYNKENKLGQNIDLLDAMLKENNHSNSEIIDQFLTLYFAGTDTTGVTFFSMLYFLGKHREVQDKIREEIKNVIGEDFSKFEFSHLKQLKYLQNVIYETIRMADPAFMNTNREVLQDHKVGEFEIKKGDFINIVNTSMMFNPKYFPEPERFNPDRWNDSKNLTNFSYSPFSGGPRNCIGQHLGQIELKVMAVRFLEHFQVFTKKDYEAKWWLKSTYQIEEAKFTILKENK